MAAPAADPVSEGADGGLVRLHGHEVGAGPAHRLQPPALAVAEERAGLAVEDAFEDAGCDEHVRGQVAAAQLERVIAVGCGQRLYGRLGAQHAPSLCAGAHLMRPQRACKEAAPGGSADPEVASTSCASGRTSRSDPWAGPRAVWRWSWSRSSCPSC